MITLHQWFCLAFTDIAFTTCTSFLSFLKIGFLFFLKIKPPLSTSPTTVVYLMNLYWHVIITQSPQFTLGFTLGVHSIGFDNCVMTCIHHCSVTEYCPKNLNVLSVHLSSPLQALATTELFNHLHSFTFSRVSYSWNHTVCICRLFFRLASFHSVVCI